MPNANQQQVGRSTIVKKVDQIESLGYLKRIKSNKDRRAYNLILTFKSDEMLIEL